MKNIIRCACGEHDIDVCNEEIVIIGDEKWRPVCALRSSAKVIDELKNREIKAEKTNKESERIVARYNILVERLKHMRCDECGFEVGPRFEVCGTGFFYCQRCYNHLAGYRVGK